MAKSPAEKALEEKLSQEKKERRALVRTEREKSAIIAKEANDKAGTYPRINAAVTSAIGAPVFAAAGAYIDGQTDSDENRASYVIAGLGFAFGGLALATGNPTGALIAAQAFSGPMSHIAGNKAHDMGAKSRSKRIAARKDKGAAPAGTPQAAG